MNKKENYFYIYKTTNLINKLEYIGQHVSINEYDNYYGSGFLLKRAINKYGKEHFKKEIIEYCKNFNELNNREIYYISKFKTLHPNGYNLTKGGEGSYGRVITEETKQKIRNSLLGNKPSKETRQKLSKARKGKKFTEEHKNNLSLALQKVDRSHTRGQKRTKETKQNISNALKGRTFSSEHKQNLSLSHKNKKLTEEHKRKISESLRKRNNVININ